MRNDLRDLLSGVALWDVCASAHRIGALDAKIVAASVVLNDFKALFAACPNIALICFNGSTSESLFGASSRNRPDHPDGATAFDEPGLCSKILCREIGAVA